MTRDSLERHQIAVYFATVALAVVVGLVMPAQAPTVQALVVPAIAALMYAMFLQIPFADLRAALAHRRFLAAVLLANFVLVPLLVWGLTRFLVGSTDGLLIGALLVLLTPCIDYVVVFTHLGRGDARLVLLATPLLLGLQLLLLPFFLLMMAGPGVALDIGPFVEAFLGLILAPLLLAMGTLALVQRRPALAWWTQGWAWAPVPAMALVLFVVIAGYIGVVAADARLLLPLLPVYVGFAVVAPLVGWLAARVCGLGVPAARAVVFSTATRNSLVVLPLALALPPEVRTLAAAAVLTQTLVELVAELCYLRAVPALVRGPDLMALKR